MSSARSSWRRCGCNCNAVTTRCMRLQMQCSYNKTRPSGTKVVSTQTCRALQNFKRKFLVSHFLERYGTPSRRYSPGPARPFRSAVTLGRRVVDPGIPVEGQDGRALRRRVLVAAGPGVDPFTGSCCEGGEEGPFAEGAYLWYLYRLEINYRGNNPTPRQTNMRDPHCVAFAEEELEIHPSHQPSTSEVGCLTYMAQPLRRTPSDARNRG